jgi:hypothetical protein
MYELGMSREKGPDVTRRGRPIPPDLTKPAGLSILDEGWKLEMELLNKFCAITKTTIIT